MICDQSTLAQIFGITPETVRQWQAAGMPYTPREAIGGGNAYDTVTVIRWRIERELRGAGQESQKDRLSRLQADRLELELAEKRGELVPAAEIEPAWSGMVQAARAQLLAFPARAAMQLAELHTFEQRRDLLVREIDTALQKLAEYDGGEPESLGGEPGAQGGETVGATVAPDGGAVGRAQPMDIGEEFGAAGPVLLRANALPSGAG